MNTFTTVKFQMVLVCSVFAAYAQSSDPQAIGAACARKYPGGTAEKITECIMEGLKSGKSPSKPAGSATITKPRKLTVQDSSSDGDKGSKNLQSSNEPETDPSKGCPYLVITKYGLTHANGTRLCFDEKSFSCDVSGKNSRGDIVYGWHVVSGKSCISGFKDARNVEFNGTNSRRALEGMGDMSGE